MPWLFITLGVLPSIVWLSIYLREDEHPEPNRYILRTFFLGALAAPFAAGMEFLLIMLLEPSPIPILLTTLITYFIVIGFVEEYWKYLAVKLSIVRSSTFDEPTDAMIYLIVAALGFAAVENVLAIFSFSSLASEAFELAFLRFISATLLHVLASAIAGYALAQKHFFFKKFQVFQGLIIAAFLHGLYNIITVSSNGFQNLAPTLLAVTLLGAMAITVNVLFYKLKKDFFQ